MNELDSILFSPRKYEERFYWTYKELLQPYNVYGAEENLQNSAVLSFTKENLQNHAGAVSKVIDISMPPPSSYTWKNTYYSDLMDLVIYRFKEMYCFYSDSEEYPTNLAKRFINKLLVIMYMTSPRYLKLLEVYESEKNKLLDPVKITSGGITRYNDTPQDEGDFANDEHTTNLTEDSRETSNELDTKMARLKEIESNYSNLLLNWSNEFESLFIEEANL